MSLNIVQRLPALLAAFAALAAASELQSGIAALRSGQPAVALRHLEAARVSSPNDVDVLYSLATCYFALGRSSDARQLTRQIASKNGRDPAVLLATGSLLLANDSSADAEVLLARAETLGPGNPMVLERLARAQQQTGRADEALNSLRRLTQQLVKVGTPETRSVVQDALKTAVALSAQDPSSVARAVVAGEFNLLLGRNAEAIATLAPLRTSGWNDADYCRLLSLAYAKTDQTREAIAAAERALKIAPARSDIVLQLAAAYQKARDNQSALRVLKRAVSTGRPSAELTFALALSQFNTGAFADAAAACDRALAVDPQFERALQLKGRALSRLSRTEEAASAFRAALRLNGGCDYCRYELAFALAALGETVEAESLLGQVAARSPQNAAVQFLLGKLLAARGEVTAAVGALEAAVASQPDHDGAWYLLSRQYAKQGEAAKASEALATVKKLKLQRTQAAEQRLAAITSRK